MTLFIKTPINIPRFFCILLRRNHIVSIMLCDIGSDLVCSIGPVSQNIAACVSFQIRSSVTNNNLLCNFSFQIRSRWEKTLLCAIT